MCRDWRRCPSSRGERKRAYQRARYAAKKAEREHASTASPGSRGVDIDGAGAGDVAPAATAAASAEAVAAGYTAPEPTTEVGRLLAESAANPVAVAARLDDPSDPLYIDPADTSDSAVAAREGVVTMLCSSDLSDTNGLDSWVSATCSHEHGEKVATAAVERAKDLHAQTDELAAVATDRDVSKAVRVTGRALSVGTGIRTARALEDTIKQHQLNVAWHSMMRGHIASDDEGLRAVHAGFFPGNDVDTAAAFDAVAGAATPMAAGMDRLPQEKAAEEVDRYMRSAAEVFPHMKRIEDVTFDEVAQFAAKHDASDTTAYRVSLSVDRVSGDLMPDSLKKDMEHGWSARVKDLMEKTKDDNTKGLTYADYDAACKAALNVGCFTSGGAKAAGDVEGDWADKRYTALRSTTSDFAGAGTTDTKDTVWFNTVRDTLNEVSPRFEDSGQFDAITAKNSQATKADMSEVKRALSMYSQRDMERFYDNFGKDEWGRHEVGRMYIEKSKKRAHFSSREYKSYSTPDQTSYANTSTRALKEFLDSFDEEGHSSRSGISTMGYTYVDDNGEVEVNSSDLLPVVGEDDYDERRQEMQDLVDRFNALPVEERRRIGNRKRKQGYRLMIDTTEEPVPGTEGKQTQKVSHIRTTTKLPSSSSKSYGMVSTVRVNSTASTTHHEVAHMVDHYVGTNNDMAQQFLSERTEGLESVQYAAGDPGERVVADSFYRPYVGKTSYGTRASEINSMGVEVLFRSPYQARETDSLPKKDGKSVVSYAPAMIDPEHHDHTLGLLAGTPQTILYSDRSGNATDHNRRVMSFIRRHGEDNPLAKSARVLLPSFDEDGNQVEGRGMTIAPLDIVKREAKIGTGTFKYALAWLNENAGAEG